MNFRAYKKNYTYMESVKNYEYSNFQLEIIIFGGIFSAFQNDTMEHEYIGQLNISDVILVLFSFFFLISKSRIIGLNILFFLHTFRLNWLDMLRHNYLNSGFYYTVCYFIWVNAYTWKINVQKKLAKFDFQYRRRCQNESFSHCVSFNWIIAQTDSENSDMSSLYAKIYVRRTNKSNKFWSKYVIPHM